MLSKFEPSEIEEKIKALHCNDEKQLEVIFSQAKKLIVEAPAGYGKTKTMISKIAYMLASNQVKNPKKILALTFSVNAAYKIKKDVAEQLPKLLQTKESYFIKHQDNLFISNYHGFCRHILKLYGYLLHETLRNIDTLKTFDDSKQEDLNQITKLGYDQYKIFIDYNKAVKDCNETYIEKNFETYVREVKEKILNRQYIPFNAIILLILELFRKYPNILEFYKNYFPTVIVDEFQDTNILSWTLLKKIISNDSRVIFIGDSLQRIYGFIGAIPKLMREAEVKYNMEIITLTKNYRFKDNPEMLQLDKNLRLNAENIQNPTIDKNAEIIFFNLTNQLEEAKKIIDIIKDLQNNHLADSCKIALLVKNRGKNIDKILKVLQENKIAYFYGLFSDEEYDYLKFHKECSLLFIEHLKKVHVISQKTLSKLYDTISESIFLKENKEKLTLQSLMKLLKVFFYRINTEYNFLSFEDKIIFIRDTFENNALKQNMEYLDENVIVATIHGAKGLEWDYVIMPDMEQYSNPSFQGLCKNCNYRNNNCNIQIDPNNETKFLEELSVFYVGVTRARRQIFFSASNTRINYQAVEKSANISCLLKLPGIKLNNDN
ncbi:UvrD-helicase domain-containing protein [Gloeothece verrucosa]|uniref:DNA 3'-5' helicase n=1 Tax=Gloeothece verrucosa (strain PCC 7822) TaxID=497965 RepID=E0UE38_GLOV7|nr:ATP-dependent helicase [Gloeothece verrucosa]ADN13042.1 UvrD/REP helicase [Gloeothece verrucosa PCC 7822]